jgi:hypothetical protein
MIIPSNRLRRVDTPDVPTPGVVPPVVPPVAPPGYVAPAATAPVAGAPVAAAPGGPKKPISKGLLIGLIAGGAALVVVAIIAVIALVLPGILGGSSTDSTDVADIGEEPDTTWKYDWVGDNDQEFLDASPSVVSVGDDSALVWADFDYDSYVSSQGNSDGWYEGYDEQYTDGYEAGLEYAAAADAYFEDTYPYTVEYPDQEDYFPEGAYDDYDEWLGFQDGFYDGAYDQGEGYSQKEEPIDPDYSPSIALINAASGDEVWTVDLTEAIDGADFQSAISAFDVEDSNAVLVVASVIDDETYKYTAVTLDKGNGDVISTLEADGPISAFGFGGDVIIGATDEDGEETTFGRYSVGDLDGDPKWDATIDGYAGVYLYGDFVLAYSSEEEEAVVVNANSGEDAEWGDDIDSEVGYEFLGSQLLRFEDNEIEGYGTNGESTWESAVDAEYYFAHDGVLLVAEEDGDAYSGLQRINASNGSEQWGDTYDDEFDYVIGVQGSSILLASGTKIIVLDAGSGEEKFSQKAGDFYGAYEGANQFYVYTGEELAAYSYGEKGDIWTLDLDESEGITVVGKHLVLLDYDKGTLNGLGA